MTTEDADTPVIVDETPVVYGPSTLQLMYPEYVAHCRRELEREMAAYFNQLAAHLCRLHRVEFAPPTDTIRTKPEQP